MGESHRIEHGRRLLDAPGPQRIRNLGPDQLTIVKATTGKGTGPDDVVEVGGEVTVTEGVYVSSSGRARIVVDRVDLEKARLAELEARIGVLENG